MTQMNKTVKKVIAREGLILLGVFIYCWVMGILADQAFDAPLEKVYQFLGLIVFVPYLCYIVLYRGVLKFIIWAIKTLKERG